MVVTHHIQTDEYDVIIAGGTCRLPSLLIHG